MKRRDLLSFASMAAFWPLAAGAQQADRVRRVGVLLPFAESDPLTEAIVTAIAQVLRRAGWVAGQNIQIDYRFAASDPTRFDLYAAELVALLPDAIIASNPQAVAPLRQRTRTIPIVFALVADPVGQGFVQSLARPGGNITGFSSFDVPLMGKWLQLLKEAAPNVTRVSVIFNPDNALYGRLFIREIEATAPSFGMTVTLAPVHDDAEIEEAVAA